MIVVMAEVGYTPTLTHAKIPEHSLITPERIENPISWCEMVIACQDIHYASHEMTIHTIIVVIRCTITGWGRMG